MPALLELNGAAVIEARLTVPRVGVWRAELVLDTDSAPAGAVTLRSDEGLEWRGTVRRVGEARGVVSVEVVGGAGGLGKAVPPKTYRNMTVRVAVTDLLGEVGERLSPRSASAVLDVSLPAWGRLAGPASANLPELFPSTASWRITADGAFWVGGETWPSVENATVNAWPERFEAELDYQPSMEPGSLHAGKRVSLVRHEVAAMRLRTRVWYE